MAPIPPLHLADLAAATESSQNVMLTPGRASARTKARALLRARARARRRDEKLTSARDCSQTLDTSPVGTVWEEDTELAHEESDDSEQHVSQPALAAAAATAKASSSLHAWEYPLSAAEKRARVLLLFGRTEMLCEQQIGRSEKREEKLRKQLRQTQQEVEKLRRQRDEFCQEASGLRAENRDMRETIAQLQGIGATKAVRELKKTEQDLQRAKRPERSSLSMTMPIAQLEAPPEPELRRLSVSSCGTASLETPRSLGLITPRGAGRAGMRGTIASIAWGEAAQVPWIVLTSRSTGMHYLFGAKGAIEIEESTISLRRGEYISMVSGCWSTNSRPYEPLLARSLKIVTSEQQEINAGAPFSSCDFMFAAREGHEIVGLTVHDGIITGVKQAILAPSRVPPGLAAVGSAEAEMAAQCRMESLKSLRRSSMSRIKEAVD